MKIAVIGSRSFNDYELMKSVLSGFDIDSIISGGAVGADALGKRYSAENGIEIIEYLPEYDKYGRGAPLVRNKQIVNESDFVIAFWDGKSRGTKYTCDYAKKQGKQVNVIRF